MKNLFKGNKILCILTFISIAIVLSYALTLNFLEKETTITTCYNILYNLALGVLINFIFFIFQLYIPNIRKQKKAFSIAKSSLEWLYFLLSDIVLSTNNFINIKFDNTIELKNKTYYFLRYNPNSEHGWLVRMEFSQQGIERYINQISHTLDTITNNFTYTYNEYTLIENLSKLQSNNYLNYLNYAIQNPKENTKYENIHKEFSDFQNIMLYLGKLLNKTCLEVYIVSDKFTIQLFEEEYNNFSESKKNGIPRQLKRIKL